MSAGQEQGVPAPAQPDYVLVHPDVDAPPVTATFTPTFTPTPSPTPEPTATPVPPTPTPTPPPVQAAAAPPRPQAPRQPAAGEAEVYAIIERYLPADPSGGLRIARCESGLNTNAHNMNAATGDDSVGIFQINIFGANLPGRMSQLRSLGYEVYDWASTVSVLKQPEANVRMAALISGGGANYSAWSCR